MLLLTCICISQWFLVIAGDIGLSTLCHSCGLYIYMYIMYIYINYIITYLHIFVYIYTKLLCNLFFK